MMSEVSFRDNRRRRIAYFRNNWGTDLQQVDEEDNYFAEDILKNPKSPLRTRRNSDCNVHPKSAMIAGTSNDIPVNSWHQWSVKSSLNQQRYASDSFCNCWRERNAQCSCGENEDTVCHWLWDVQNISKAATVNNNDRDIVFHSDYSCGTACVKGCLGFLEGQHFWEIKLTTPVYGTDMMIGIGTEFNELNRNELHFCSMLGENSESWGLSFTGTFHHNGEGKCFSPRFTQGSIIGLHLDMWFGTLSFYKNRKPLGIACSNGLLGKLLFPMVCSTAAKTGMRLVRSKSFKSSLQYLCCLELRRKIPQHLDVLEVLNLPPGLNSFLRENLDWILLPTVSKNTKRQSINDVGRTNNKRIKHFI